MAAFALEPMHKFTVANSTFEVPVRYSLIRSVGTGAYGVVMVKVAIKKIPRAFEDLVDAKRILREIRLLRQFDHENIISVVNVLPPTDDTWSDLYIVSELMETDLHRIIYSKQPLSPDHVQYFTYQILRALKYMHSANVIHRDLKPSNLLVNSNCDLKVCDLGLARGIEPEASPGSPGIGELTEYVVTRWYRAPEIMLSCQEYTKAIDVWSVGCIFAELILRDALFPGDDYIDQIRKICTKVGKPRVEDLDFVTSDKARRFILDLPDEIEVQPMAPLDENRVVNTFEAKGGSLAAPMDDDDRGAPMDDGAQQPPSDDMSRFAQHFAHRITEPGQLDLVVQMLVFNPRRRCDVVDALNHPYMASLHLESDEPTAGFNCAMEFEHQNLDRAGLKALVWDEMLAYNPSLDAAFNQSSSSSRAAAAAGLMNNHQPAHVKLEPTDEPLQPSQVQLHLQQQQQQHLNRLQHQHQHQQQPSDIIPAQSVVAHGQWRPDPSVAGMMRPAQPPPAPDHHHQTAHQQQHQQQPQMMMMMSPTPQAANQYMQQNAQMGWTPQMQMQPVPAGAIMLQGGQTWPPGAAMHIHNGMQQPPQHFNGGGQ